MSTRLSRWLKNRAVLVSDLRRELEQAHHDRVDLAECLGRERQRADLNRSQLLSTEILLKAANQYVRRLNAELEVLEVQLSSERSNRSKVEKDLSSLRDRLAEFRAKASEVAA